MSSFIVEVVLGDTKVFYIFLIIYQSEEIKKYTIDEKIIDNGNKIDFLLKNGDERQKLYIINNFYKIFNNYKNQKHLELISQCIKMGIDYCKKLRNDETYKTFFKSIIEFTKILINEKININDTINSIYENIIIHILPFFHNLHKVR